MIHIPENARLADDPIEVRRQAQITLQREIEDGMMRRHVAIGEEARFHSAVNFDRALKNGQAIGKKLRGL